MSKSDFTLNEQSKGNWLFILWEHEMELDNVSQMLRLYLQTSAKLISCSKHVPSRDLREGLKVT